MPNTQETATCGYARTLAASVRWLEADDAARQRPAYMSVEDVGVRVADNLSVIDPFPLLHLLNPNVPAAVADFGFRGFAIAGFLAVLLDASIAARQEASGFPGSFHLE